MIECVLMMMMMMMMCRKHRCVVRSTSRGRAKVGYANPKYNHFDMSAFVVAIYLRGDLSGAGVCMRGSGRLHRSTPRCGRERRFCRDSREGRRF